MALAARDITKGRALRFLLLRLHSTRIGQQLVKLLLYRRLQALQLVNTLLVGGQHHLAAQKPGMLVHLGRLIQHEHSMLNGHGILILLNIMATEILAARSQVIKLKHMELT